MPQQAHAGPSSADFFRRLRGLDGVAPAVGRVFDTLMLRPLAAPAPEFFRRMYRKLVRRAMSWLDIPCTPGAAEWEWRAVFRLDSEIDPGYFTREQIAGAIHAGVPLAPAHRQALADLLHNYFRLRGQGFPATFPATVPSTGDCERWAAIFPPQQAWQGLEILAELGLYPLGVRAAYRAFVRFHDGRFDPEWNADSLRRWQSACWGAAGEERSGSGETEPQRLDFLAAAFGGAYGPLGLSGPCGEVPACGECPLQTDCAWTRSPAREERDTGALLARAHGTPLTRWELPRLLATLFRAEGAERTALEALWHNNTLRGLATLPPPELAAALGGGNLHAAQLEALFEICRRFGEERLTPGRTLRTGQEVFRHFRMRLRDLRQEQLLVVLVDMRRRYLGETLVSQGTLDGSMAHPRDIFHAAIRAHAGAVLVVHNHPSGNPEPSTLDLSLTRTLVDAGRLVGIPVLDHVVTGDETYVSMLEEGLVDF